MSLFSVCNPDVYRGPISGLLIFGRSLRTGWALRGKALADDLSGDQSRKDGDAGFMIR